MISFHTAQSLGLRSISSALKKEYVVHYLYLVNLVNTFVKTKKNNIPISKLEQFASRYDYIFISSTSYNKNEVFLMADTIKRKNPNIKLILGGNLAMFEPEDCVKHFDFVCVWEGHTISELLAQIESGKKKIAVDNFISKEFKTASFSMPNNLDELPLPDYSPENSFFIYKNEIVKKDFSPKILTFRTTIGCVYSCSFCYINYLNKVKRENKLPSYIEMSIEKVIKSLITLKKTIKNAQLVRIVDENFFYRELEDIKYFIKEYNRHIDLPLIVEVDPRSKDFIEKFDEVATLKNKIQFVIAIQTGSEEFNARIYKRIQKNNMIIENHSKISDIIKRKRPQMKLVYGFIYLNPLETKSDILETINLMLKLPRASYVFCSLSLMPKSEITEMLADYYEGLDHPGELNYKYFKKYSFYYFMYFFIKILNVLKLNQMLPTKLNQTSVTEFMNLPIFAPIYYILLNQYICFMNLRQR
jgi:radical SAM superfamily enzyme YgiQ (UPF0313 family)